MFLSPSLYGIFRSGLSVWHLQECSFWQSDQKRGTACFCSHLCMASSGVVFLAVRSDWRDCVFLSPYLNGIFRSVLSGSQIRLEGLRVSVAISVWHLQECSFWQSDGQPGGSACFCRHLCVASSGVFFLAVRSARRDCVFLSPSLYGIFRSGLSVWHLQECSFWQSDQTRGTACFCRHI